MIIEFISNFKKKSIKTINFQYIVLSTFIQHINNIFKII